MEALSGNWSSLLLLVGFFAVMYFLLIRPENKKQKETQNMQNSLQPGDEVMTVGGICGTVVRIKDDKIVIQTGTEKVKLEMAKNAIGQKLNSEPAKTVKKEKTKATSPKGIKKLGEKTEDEAKSAPEAASAAESVEVKAEAVPETEEKPAE